MNDQLMYLIVAVVVAVGVVAAVVALFSIRNRRTERLRQRFGPEYERTIGKTGDVRRAETALRDRETRVERLRLRPLTPDEARRFSTEWQFVQARFVVPKTGSHRPLQQSPRAEQAAPAPWHAPDGRQIAPSQRPDS